MQWLSQVEPLLIMCHLSGEFLFVEDHIIFEIGSWLKLCPVNAKNENIIDYKRSARAYVSIFKISP